MDKENEIPLEAREALEQLREEFAREFILYNPNPGITIDELIENTERLTKE